MFHLREFRWYDTQLAATKPLSNTVFNNSSSSENCRCQGRFYAFYFSTSP